MCTVHLKTTTTTPPSNRSLVCFSYSRRRADYTVVCELQCSYDLQPTKIKWNWKTNAWQSYDRLKEIQQQKPSVRIFITCHFFSPSPYFVSFVAIVFVCYYAHCVFSSLLSCCVLFCCCCCFTNIGFFRQSILMNTTLWFCVFQRTSQIASIYLSVERLNRKNGPHFFTHRKCRACILTTTVIGTF